MTTKQLKLENSSKFPTCSKILVGSSLCICVRADLSEKWHILIQALQFKSCFINQYVLNGPTICSGKSRKGRTKIVNRENNSKRFVQILYLDISLMTLQFTTLKE